MSRLNLKKKQSQKSMKSAATVMLGYVSKLQAILEFLQ